MTESLLPEQIEELMAGYVLGDLSPEEAEALQQFLSQNPQRATEVHRFEETWELLPYALPEVEPPPQLRSAILNVASIPVNQTPEKKLSRLPWDKMITGVAALLALAFGLDNYRLRQALQATQTDTGSFAKLTYSLQRTDAVDNASARVVVNPNNLEAKLTIQDLPPLPEGKVYVLWTVLKPDAPFTTDPKGAILTQVFEVDEQGNASQIIAVPKVYRSQELVAKVAVTIEDAKSPQKHEGTPILIAKQ
jgi:anti-sigma-K factor RskA